MKPPPERTFYIFEPILSSRCLRVFFHAVLCDPTVPLYSYGVWPLGSFGKLWRFHSTSFRSRLPAGSAHSRLGVAGSTAGCRDTAFAGPSLLPSTNPLVLPLVPRPLHRGLLLHHRPAPLGVAGPLCATTWLLGPGPELPLVPRRWTSKSLLVGGATPPPAWRVEAVRQPLSTLKLDFTRVIGGFFCAYVFHP